MKHFAYLWLSVLMIILSVPARANTSGTAAEDTSKAKQEMPAIQNTKFAMVNPETEAPLTYKLPADTLQVFLKRFGKDSLVHLLDQRISLARNYLSVYSFMMNDEHAMTISKLISKEFKLGLDTARYPNFKTDTYFLKLYGRYYGNVFSFFDTVKLKSMSADQFHDMYVPAFKDTNIYSRIALPLSVLAPYVDITKKTVDALVKHYSTIYLPDAPYYLYYALREYGRNSPAKKALTDPYAKALSDSLYANNNFSKAMDKHLAENQSTGYMQDFLKPVKFLAYGLYTGDVQPDRNGSDLMYLLMTQRSDGGWYSVIGNNRDIEMSVYGMWALCEFRRQVQAIQ